jgi:hypothetical protein
MQKMYIERHHGTGRIVLRAVAKGSMGGDLIMADLGTAEKCEKAGAPVLPTNRVPSYLVQQAEAQAPGATRMKMKYQPDMFMMKDAAVHIPEFKYCRDTEPGDQLTACLNQHTDLVQLLIQNGHQQNNIKIVPILIGTSGTIYNEHTVQAMTSLGISMFHAKKCAQKCTSTL